MRDGLKDGHRDAIITAIAANDRVERAVLFGSRATGTNTVSSDVDIALFGDRLTLTDQARLAAALDEIPMAQSVDLLLYDSIRVRTLREHIRDQGVVLYARLPLSHPDHRINPTISTCALVPDDAETSFRWKRHDVDDLIRSGYLAVGDGYRAKNSELARAGLPFARAGNIADRFRFSGADRFPEFFGQFTSVSGQTDMADYVSLTDQRRMSITLPPVAEQRAIARVLGTLDDKIELNQRMNATLEAMARALFKSWFGDFDPVRAKMDRHDTGLPGHIAELFPCRIAASEIGDVPMGWDEVPLSHIIDVNPTRRLRKGQMAPYLDMANMPTTGHIPQAVIDRPYGSGMRFTNGDTLVARITPCLENGKTAYVDFLQAGATGWGSTEYIVMRPRTPFPPEFAYCLARSAHFREFLIRNMSGTSGRQRVPAQALFQFMCVRPSESVAQVFEKIVRPIMRRASAAARESRRLSRLRDTLLPRLLAGELRIDR